VEYYYFYYLLFLCFHINFCYIYDINCKNFSQRLREFPPLSEEEIESRALLQKEWARYKRQEYLKDIQIIDSIFYSQQKALDELKAESEELYQEAIQVIIVIIDITIDKILDKIR